MLDFCPLYWIYHDCWRWEETTATSPRRSFVSHTHAGHCHLFMPDFNPSKNASRQAYSGKQVYSFRIEDVWGPNSKDPNQSRPYILVGKPRWYFHIEEYWRRCYIQPWESEDLFAKYPRHKGRLGIRYDASLPQHTLGPFRESRGCYFFATELNRTLPVEYWLDREANRREHFLRRPHDARGKDSWDETRGGQTWTFRPAGELFRKVAAGYHYRGENAIYGDDIAAGPVGFHAKGDYAYTESGGVRRFWRYSFVPTEPMPGKGVLDVPERYLPNPTPGISGEELEDEYLRYLSFNAADGNRWRNAFQTWLGKRGRTQELFLEFVQSKTRELMASCFETKFVGGSDGMQTATDYDSPRYEWVSFSEYAQVWEAVSAEEAERLELNGSYPLRRESPDLSECEDPYERYRRSYSFRDVYSIPRGTVALGDCVSPKGTHPGSASYSDEDGARRNLPDRLFVGPILEYQKVTHLDYERLPEAAALERGIDVLTDKTGAWGDGFEVSIEIPYRVNGVIQSPFSDDAKRVAPAGTYYHGVVPEERKLRVAAESYGEPIPEEAVEKFLLDGSADAIPGMENAEKYANEAYRIFMSGEPSPAAQREWFNSNYAGRPILFNPEEGRPGADGEWNEVRTLDRPLASECEADPSTGEPIPKGRPAVFDLHGLKEDGVWVEQCLGAVVIPRVELVFEDRLGHRWTQFADATAIQSGHGFTPTDA